MTIGEHTFLGYIRGLKLTIFVYIHSIYPLLIPFNL